MGGLHSAHLQPGRRLLHTPRSGPCCSCTPRPLLLLRCAVLQAEAWGGIPFDPKPTPSRLERELGFTDFR